MSLKEITLLELRRLYIEHFTIKAEKLKFRKPGKDLHCSQSDMILTVVMLLKLIMIFLLPFNTKNSM